MPAAGGQITLGTSSIGSNACATAATLAVTGTTATSGVAWSFASDPNTITGYGAGATGTLAVWVYPTTNTVNARVCNLTGGSITPGVMSLNVRVIN